MDHQAEIIIGVGGFAGAGKDTVAGLLVDHFGFRKVAFADPMRSMAEAIDPVVGFGDEVPIRYNDAIEMCGYTEAKVLFPEIRQFLQRLGAEGGRDILGEDVWINHAFSRIRPGDRVVISDMRYANEAAAIKKAGGYLIRVTRPGVNPVNDHGSEHDLDATQHDLYLNNNSTPEDMIVRLEQFFARTATKILRTT